MSDLAKQRRVVYKADVQHCTTKRGVLFSVRLNKMARMSCKGCDRCGGLADDLSNINANWSIIGIESAKSGKLYEIKMVNMSTDWETGYVDEWDLQLVPYEESEADSE